MRHMEIEKSNMVVMSASKLVWGGRGQTALPNYIFRGIEFLGPGTDADAQ